MLRSLKYGLYGAVLAGIVSGTVAWHSVDKTVSLVVDGQVRHVHTTADRVGEILQAEGYRVGAHDLVAPTTEAKIHNGSRIILNRGRLLRLDVNNVHREVWTTAPTVAAALDQLGYSSADFTSVSRARRLPLAPTDLSLRTPLFVTVVADGKTQRVTTIDATVGQLLNDMGVPLSPADQVSTVVSSPLAAGQQIVIGRVGRSTVTATQVLSFATKTETSTAVPTGETKVLAAGKDGLATVTYEVVTVNGKVVGKTPIKSVVVRAPQSQVVAEGTAAATSSTLAGSASAGSASAGSASIAVTPGSAQAIGRTLAADRGWGADQFSCLVSLWDHESGWRVDAANPSGAYGIPQALPGSKMGSAGANWQSDAATQITWGLDYIAGRYGTPCGAWSSWQAQGGWY